MLVRDVVPVAPPGVVRAQRRRPEEEERRATGPERRGAVVLAEVLGSLDGLIDAVQEALDVRPVALVGRLDDPIPQRFAVVRLVRLSGRRRPGRGPG